MAPEAQRVAIVTGSAKGIGECIALKLAEDGFDIALNDLPTSEESLKSLAEKIRQKGRKACLVMGDVSVESDVKEMIDSTVKYLGGIDVMVANAGIFRVGSFLEASQSDFEKIFAVNVGGTFLCFKHAAEHMIKQGRGGRLIAATSVAGLTGQPFVALYSSTKFAIRGLVLSTAKELGKYGITVNAYAPAAVEGTGMYPDVKEKMAGILGLPDVETLDTIQKQSTAVGYLGTGDDVANAVSFLVKKESHFITGHTLTVSGGKFVH